MLGRSPASEAVAPARHVFGSAVDNYAASGRFKPRDDRLVPAPGGSRRRRGFGTAPTSSAEDPGEAPAAPRFRMTSTIHSSAPKASRARSAPNAESSPSTTVYTSVGI